MTQTHFTVRVHYKSNNYQIIADDHKYSMYGCICNTMSGVMVNMFQITDRLAKQGVKANFTFINTKEEK